MLRPYIIVLLFGIFLLNSTRVVADSCDEIDCSCQDCVDLGKYLGGRQCTTNFVCKADCEAKKALCKTGLKIPPAPSPSNPTGPLPDQAKKILDDARTNAEQFVATLPNQAGKAVNDALNSGTKAVRDAAETTVKAANDIVDAGKTVARFYERQLQSYPGMLSNAQERLRDGKVIDALWHISTDQAKATEDNAGRAVEENEIVRAAAQAAAGAYGGPAGSAAFAAWMAYRQSGGNVDLALRAGAIAYAQGSVAVNTGAMPTSTLDEVAKKAAMTGAVAGISVAASGGSDQEALDAFVKSSGAVVVQAGQSYVKEQAAAVVDTDSLSVQADVYCTTMTGGTCAEVKQNYNEIKDYVDAAKKIQSKDPNVVFTSDGDWAVSWTPRTSAAVEAAVQPPAVLTYVGPHSPYFAQFEKLAALGGGGIEKSSSLGWIYLGRRHSDGTWKDPRSPDLVGPAYEDLTNLTIVLTDTVNRHIGPRGGCNLGDDTPIIGQIASGPEIHILATKRLRPGCSNYIWAEVEAAY